MPSPLTHDQLETLDAHLGLSQSGNAEVLFAWLELALGNRYDPAVPAAVAFLAKVGRRKFVLPLFEVLMGEGEWGAPIARRIYAGTRPGYHSVTQGSVDKVVQASGLSRRRLSSPSASAEACLNLASRAIASSSVAFSLAKHRRRKPFSGSSR